MKSNRPLQRLRIEPDALTREQDGSLIDRYLGTSFGSGQIAYVGIPSDHPLAGVQLHLIDTSYTAAPAIDQVRATIWHVLWVRDENSATVSISSPHQEETWRIAPGDSILVPAAASFATDGGQLALAITIPEGNPLESRADPPTHGTDQFFGYNRHTAALMAGGLKVSRWKLTQPLAFADHYRSRCIVVALARNVTVRTTSTIDLLNQGQAALIDPMADPIISPDGLAYLLTIEAAPPEHLG